MELDHSIHVLIICLACTGTNNRSNPQLRIHCDERQLVSCQWLAKKKATTAEDNTLLTEVNAATMRKPGTFYCHDVG